MINQQAAVVGRLLPSRISAEGEKKTENLKVVYRPLHSLETKEVYCTNFAEAADVVICIQQKGLLSVNCQVVLDRGREPELVLWSSSASTVHELAARFGWVYADPIPAVGEEKLASARQV